MKDRPTDQVGGDDQFRWFRWLGQIYGAHPAIHIVSLPQDHRDLDSWTKLFAPFIADNSDIECFIGTHGFGLLTAAKIKEQFQYLKKLSQEVESLKAAGKSAAESQALLPLAQFPYLSKFNPYFYGTDFSIHDSNINVLWNRTK